MTREIELINSVILGVPSSIRSLSIVQCFPLIENMLGLGKIISRCLSYAGEVPIDYEYCIFYPNINILVLDICATLENCTID